MKLRTLYVATQRKYDYEKESLRYLDKDDPYEDIELFPQHMVEYLGNLYRRESLMTEIVITELNKSFGVGF